MNRNYVWSAIVCAAFALPVLGVAFLGPPLLTFAHEFIAYRIGDAIALLNGEGDFVRPVQGIPNALLSKLLVWGLSLFGWLPDYSGFQTYILFFMSFTVAAFVAVIVTAWLSGITLTEKLAVSAFALFPLYLGTPSPGLYFSPDYWIFEHLWLTGTLLILFVRPAQSFWLGVWVGIGATIKIPLGLMGAALLLILRRINAPAIIGGILGYAAVNGAYGLEQTIGMIERQFSFFAKPNYSASYQSARSAMWNNPHIYVLGTAATIGALYKRQFVWLLPIVALAYLVVRRPHDSSLSSTALALAFITLATLRLRFAIPALVVAGWLTGFFLPNWWMHQIQTKFRIPEDMARLSAERGTWLMDGNAGSALLLPQLMGYNGQLALREEGESLGAFHRYFPDSRILDINDIDEAMSDGAHIIWTERVGPSRTAAEFARRGYTLSHEDFTSINGQWRFYSATPAPGSDQSSRSKQP